MKFTKMSLIAAMLMGSSAFAMDNVEADGDARFFYSSSDKGTSLFDVDNAIAEAAIRLGVTGDFTQSVSGKATVYGVTPLGITNNVAAGSWTGGTTTNAWLGEASIKAKAGETEGTLGRMELDTPLVFTETWSIAPNTFEALLITNDDIPQTQLVASYVGRGNGGVIAGGITDITIAGQTDARSDVFSNFYEGAYAFGAVNNSWEPLTAQLWYYNAQHTVNSYWLQADLDLSGFLAGIQYTGGDYYQDSVNNENLTGTAFAAMLGYQMGDTLTLKASFSQTGADHRHGGNLGTLAGGAEQSKLYTEAWWNYGFITRADTMSFNGTVEYSMDGIADFGLYGTGSKKKNATNMYEGTLSASKSFDNLDTSLVYVYSRIGGNENSVVQAYLTYNFDIKKK